MMKKIEHLVAQKARDIKKKELIDIETLAQAEKELEKKKE